MVFSCKILKDLGLLIILKITVIILLILQCLNTSLLA